MNRKAVIFAVCAMTGAMTLGACGNTISEEISKQEKAGTRKEKKPKDSTESVSKKNQIHKNLQKPINLRRASLQRQQNRQIVRRI